MLSKFLKRLANPFTKPKATDLQLTSSGSNIYKVWVNNKLSALIKCTSQLHHRVRHAPHGTHLQISK